jgi:hypothetical protein
MFDIYGIVGENEEASIEYIDSPSRVNLTIDDIDYYGKGVFIIPATITADADISYFIYKPDYWGLDDELAASISIGEWNDHYFSAEESHAIDIELNISISMDTEILEQEDVSDEALLAALCEGSVEADSVDSISLNFDSND